MFQFADLLRRAGLAIAACCLAWTVALAQQALFVGIDPIRASLDQIEAASKAGRHGVRSFTELAQQVGPLRDLMRDKLADLEPRLADIDARLKGLGPAPARDAAPEDGAIAAERARLSRQRGEVDAAIKQVQLLLTRADQLANALADRRRAAYAETLFRRSPNVLDPFFWRDVFAAVPDYGSRLAQFGQNWISYAREKGGAARAAFACLALIGLAIFTFGLARWWRRHSVVSRVHARYGKALAAMVVFARRAFTAPVAVLVVLELLEQFELIPSGFERLTTNLVVGTAIAALARAAATSVLAPENPARRLTDFDDASAKWLSAHLIWGGRLFGAFIVLRALHRAAGTPQVIDDATRMLFAVVIVALLVHLLIGRRETEEEEASRRFPGVRLLAWIAVACVLGALLAGYAGFASFLAGRVVFTVALVATLYLLLVVTDALINRTLSADSPGGRKFARQLGIEPRRLGLIGKLTSGIARAMFVLIVVALAVGRWEIAAADLFEAVKGVAFGIRIGDFTISFGAVLGAIAFFLVVVVLTRADPALARRRR